MMWEPLGTARGGLGRLVIAHSRLLPAEGELQEAYLLLLTYGQGVEENGSWEGADRGGHGRCPHP